MGCQEAIARGEQRIVAAGWLLRQHIGAECCQTPAVERIGDSLLVVGSSTDEQLITKAAGMIGQPSCIWTDPPYGVAYQGGTKEHLTIENDNDPNKAVEITKQAMQVATKICKP